MKNKRIAALIAIFTFMTSFNLNSPLWLFVVTSLFYGVRMGLFQSPNNSVIMSSVDQQFLGIAGSVNSLARNLLNNYCYAFCKEPQK